MAKKSGGGATAPKPVVKPASKVAPKAAAPAKPSPAAQPQASAKGPVKVYSSPPKPTTPKPIQSPAKAARVMSSPKPAPSAPTSTAGSRAASAMTSTAGKKVAQTAGKTLLKTAGKAVLKRLPYVGAAIGAYELGSAAIDAYKENKKANAPKGTGDIMSTMEKNKGKSFNASGKPSITKPSVAKPNAAQQKSADEYYTKLASGPKKTTAPKASSEVKRKPVRTAAVEFSAKRDITKQGAPSKPSVPDIQSRPERTDLSKREAKMVAQIQKIKSGKTSTEAAQARIASLQARERMANQRAARKEKRAAVKSAKANVKAVKRSYKK